jgi:OFA family oxalate/formate antiporter-like MFS transporter
MMLAFTTGMIAGGWLQDRLGPRLIGAAGGILLGGGCVIAALSQGSAALLIAGYGVVGGLGIGFAYASAVACCVRWFPDCRGRIVGLAVLGFGAGSLIFGPLCSQLLGSDPDRYAQSLRSTFLTMAALFTGVVVCMSLLFSVPPEGWTPKNWVPSVPKGEQRSYRTAEMLRTWQFHLLAAIFVVGTSLGFVTIAETSAVVKLYGGDQQWISAGVAVGLVGVFNGLGRLVWGWVSDRLGRERTLAAICVLGGIVGLGYLTHVQDLALVLVGLCAAVFVFGGFLALMPALCADYYGERHAGANYGLLFTAFGLTGFLAPLVSAEVLEAARNAGNLVGGYQILYLGLGVGCLLAVVPSVLMRPPGRQAVSAPADLLSG